MTSATLRRVLSLADRVELLCEYPPKWLPARRVSDAQKTIRRWRGTKPFDDAVAFSTYLSLSGLSEGSLPVAICFPATKRVRKVADLTHLAEQLRFLCTSPLTLPNSDTRPDGHDYLLNLVYPLVAATVDHIIRDLSGIGGEHPVPDAGVVRRQAESDFRSEMLLLVQKTCLWELKLAKLGGHLRGRTRQDRYRCFVAQLATPAHRRRVFEQYPVLFESVCKRLDMYRRNTVNMLNRLIADSDALSDAFFEAIPLAPLDSWKVGAGDSHCRGQSVVCLSFHDGRKLIYKPRSLEVDVGFAELVSWCNSRLPRPGLKTARVINRDTYGWSEYIPYKESESVHEVETFYSKQGRFLALFYCLRASDMHHENVICNGPDPVYVDLETLFHAQLRGTNMSNSPGGGAWPTTIADTQVIEARLNPGADGTLPDLSALGAHDGQPYPGHAFDVVDPGTDDARLEEVKIDWSVGGNHLPKLCGKYANANDYSKQLLFGFVEMYDLMLKNKTFLSSDEGLGKWFSKADVRLIARPTELYETFIQRSLHPDFLSDAAERECFLGQLFDGSHTSEPNWMNALVPSEIADMGDLDVPLFFQHFGGGTIYSSKGVRLNTGKFSSPKDLVSQHILGLTHSDRDAQVRLIASVLGPPHWSPCLEDDAGYEKFHKSLRDGRLADAAAVIGDQIAAEAVQRGNDRYWICKPVTSNGPMFSASAIDLYDGILGLILFLGVLSKVSERQDYGELAISALHTVRRWTTNGTRGFSNLGVFSGVFGLPYVLACLASVTGRSDLRRESLALVAEIDLNNYVDNFDVFGGAAGVILFLRSLLEDQALSVQDRAVVEARMERLADGLLSSYKRQAVGVGWLGKQRGAAPVPLTGFAHGNAGIAAALYVAAHALGIPKYRALADEAIAYEDAHRTKAEDNWLDLREISGTSEHGEGGRDGMCALCHGAAGVLLGRLICLEHVDEDGHSASFALRNDAVTAANTTWQRIEHGEMDNVSICHGLLGNLEILNDARALPCAHARVRALSLADQRVAWCCGDDVGSGVTSPTADPGLMIGRAGVGYALLRRAAPAFVPSIIRLEHLANPSRDADQDSSTAWPVAGSRPTSCIGV